MSDERLDKHQRMRLFCRQTRDRISWRGLRELLRRARAALGAPSAELQIARLALGDVPLVGFLQGGEIARNHLYGYTGVLTVFTQVWVMKRRNLGRGLSPLQQRPR